MRTCDYCNEPHLAIGMCNKHYRRFKRYGDPHYTKFERDKTVCTICGDKNYAKGLCTKHYQSDYQHKRIAESKCKACGEKHNGGTIYCATCKRWNKVKAKERYHVRKLSV